ncbi:EAL domain-containing protein [Vibrio sp. JPW-9-11-11]|uniref:putative bifunctional diguanylate cyclase/phosphodiesterase n=1 Tax=Vibrio sp. JPW-9-11-11 TaxID=1416532 RepID=UPI0015948FFD|nr:GGDEF domain-containing phosphodiesterase [Vibrio sp. JPW-9-11-11]NVD08892.1 EAL domain-containing protein [Vibrio sp. JPW-9-11-11]
MVRTTSVQAPLSVDTVNGILSLDGLELLNKATYELHQYSQSFCTCIIELDQFTAKSNLLASASNQRLHRGICLSPISRTSYSFVTQSNQDVIVCQQGALSRHSEEPFILDNDIEAYIGVPLKTHNGEILGILLSTYRDAIEDKDVKPLVYFHKLVANIVTHHLKAKWLTARADSLVDQLSYEVSHDNLTGLLNRGYLSDKLQKLIESPNTPFTLAYLDIDNFKSINDLHGNYIGDQIIKFVATTIKDALKDKQLAYRIAGDEFAFITLSGDPFTVCNEIIEKLDRGYQDQAHTIQFNISIGLANSGGQTHSADQILNNASLALKDCKQSKHTSVQCYDTHLSAQYYRRALVIDALRSELNIDNISNSEIYVVAQPIVRKDHARWDYFEILARWQSKALGAVSPVEFIDAAEQSGLIVKLGERIVELACKAKYELEQGLGHPVRLSINCSAHEFNNSARYLEHLLTTLRRYNFTPQDFTIELTETVLLTRTNEVQQILSKLRILGFKVALDDFGTGYSSLNYIHSYPIDCFKIDASFIQNMLKNETAERLVWLMVQLAEQLNVCLIAEGVEDEITLDKLYQMGCTQIQGYYFSRPEPPRQIVDKYLAYIDKQRVSNG